LDLCTSSDGNPWLVSGTTYITVPSTVLLPAGIIKSMSSWTLPSGTRLVGEGGEDPGLNVLTTSRTIIQAQANFECPPATCTDADFPVIKMGTATGCTGVSIEDLVIDGGPASGNNVDVNGIDNPNCGDQSYVKNVTIYRIVDIGLNVFNSSDPSLPQTNSGPFSNITFDPASLLITGGQTVGAYLNASTRGIQGMTCTTGNVVSASSTGTCVTVASSGNSIEDIRIEGFSTGVDVSASNTVLMNIDGDTNPKAGGAQGTVLNVVTLERAVTNVALIGITNNCTSSTVCSGTGADGKDSTINDLATGAQILVSTNPFVAMYVLGDKTTIVNGTTTTNAYSRYATSASLSTTTGPSTANWQVGSGVPANPTNGCAAGSLYSNSASSSFPALYVCSANSTYFGTWQPVD